MLQLVTGHGAKALQTLPEPSNTCNIPKPAVVWQLKVAVLGELPGSLLLATAPAAVSPTGSYWRIPPGATATVALPPTATLAELGRAALMAARLCPPPLPDSEHSGGWQGDDLRWAKQWLALTDLWPSMELCVTTTSNSPHSHEDQANEKSGSRTRLPRLGPRKRSSLYL